MGTNRNTTGSTGLKILCNNLSTVYRCGIYVVPTVLTNNPPSFGIASQQNNSILTLINPPIIAFTSAANTFSNASPLTKDFEVFPTGNPVTPYTEIYYRYSPYLVGEKPINTNLLAANVISTSYSTTCSAKATGAIPAPFPFALFVKNNMAIEKQIRAVKANAIASTDTADILAYLYTSQASLIDSIVNYYQYMNYTDSLGNGIYIDSLARVYQQVTTQYEYQIYQASAYRDLGRYQDAFTLLNSLDGDESRQIAHIVDMYKATQWLQQNNSDWSRMPAAMKGQVYQYEYDDPMFAGAIARSLLAQYEGRSYDPVYIAPDDIYTTMNYKMSSSTNYIYPNPATDYMIVNYIGDNAMLILTDMLGREVLRRPLNNNQTTVNIEKLPAGMYYAAIWSGATIQYRQKVVKQ